MKHNQPALRWVNLANVVMILAAFPAGGTVLGFFGKYYWLTDLFAHFRVQYFVSLAVACIVFFVARRPWAGIVAGVLSLINLGLILPLYLAPETKEAATDKSIRVMLVNVNVDDGDPERLMEVVGEYAPDVLVLQEVNGWWMERLQTLKAVYPHAVERPRGDNFGIALLSRWPLADAGVDAAQQKELRTVVALVHGPDWEFTVVGAHPHPPMGAEFTRLRNRRLGIVAEVLRDLDGPVVFVGDLNTTPWSHVYQEFARKSGLVDSLPGWGIQPTWPTWVPPLYIPLDHCFHSEELAVVERRTGRRFGSDHLPLIVEFAFTSQ